MWINRRNVEKPLKSGKIAGNRGNPCNTSLKSAPTGSQQQHAVAVRVEAVALPDGMGVGVQNRPAALLRSAPLPHKRCNQHKQRGFWQMEVRQKAVD